MIYSNKGLSAIVATSLLIVVAVAAIVSFQTWFNTYSSSLYTDVEGTSSGALGTQVERVIGSTIYFNNNFKNLTITDVKVEGISCNITGSYNDTLESFDGTHCLNDAQNGVKEVVFYTDKGVFSSKFVYVEGSSSSSLACSDIPYGEWVEVSGNPTLGSSDFCVMKYEAKATNLSLSNLYDSGSMHCGDGTDDGGNSCLTDGSVNITSKAEFLPLTQVYQTEAKQLCENLGEGYQLITDAQWVTIAREIESLSSNWANGVLGSTVSEEGGIYRGNVNLNDNISCGSGTVLDAETSGTNCILDEGNKRTLNLQSGGVIWDFSGNVQEWTDDTFDNNTQSSLGTTAGIKEWTEISGYNYLKSINLSYNSSNGIGVVSTDADDASPSGIIHAFNRGGRMSVGDLGGIYALYLSNSPFQSYYGLGFRCTYTP